jgi:hypothetical protein
MSPHTVWIGGPPIALLASEAPRAAGVRDAATPKDRPHAGGRPPTRRCATCLFSTFRKDFKNHVDRRESPADCRLKRIAVRQDDGGDCSDWEYWRGAKKP